MLVQLLIRAYHSGSPLSASRTTVMPKQSLSQGTERKASQHSLGLLDQDFWAILALCTKICGCFPLFSLSLIRLQLIRMQRLSPLQGLCNVQIITIGQGGAV